MKTNRPVNSSIHQGFTLIELLVVIVIIGILASLVMSQATKMIADARKLQVQTVIKDLRIAIGGYLVEYNRYPVDSSLLSGSDGEDAPEMQTDEKTGIVDALMSTSSSDSKSNLNPKDIKFIDLPLAKNGMFGLVNAQPPYKLTDLWGQTYRVLLDTNGDKQVKNPDLQNSDPKISQNPTSPPPQKLPTEVAIYSTGLDKVASTADDVVSWRQK
jgi:prepilin-type N-terminal cleavage/methylation domain-containing protein|uniref:type II secretion system protein n=1 Tax=Prosthecobacter sp. TaxID=1965333 RepID=UPI003783BA8A